VQLLVVGGLFVIALIALIALFFVVRSEPHRNGTAAASASDGEKNEISTHRAEPTQPVTQHIPISVHREEQRLPREAHARPIMNGQLRELSAELHDLHQQAQDIEQRLSILTEMIERIERSQAGRPSIEEEV